MRKFFICKEENNTPGVGLQCVALALAVALIARVLHPLSHKHNVAQGKIIVSKSAIIVLQYEVCISQGG